MGCCRLLYWGRWRIQQQVVRWTASLDVDLQAVRVCCSFFFISFRLVSISESRLYWTYRVVCVSVSVHAHLGPVMYNDWTRIRITQRCYQPWNPIHWQCMGFHVSAYHWDLSRPGMSVMCNTGNVKMRNKIPSWCWDGSRYNVFRTVNDIIPTLTLFINLHA